MQIHSYRSPHSTTWCLSICLFLASTSQKETQKEAGRVLWEGGGSYVRLCSEASAFHIPLCSWQNSHHNQTSSQARTRLAFCQFTYSAFRVVSYLYTLSTRLQLWHNMQTVLLASYQAQSAHYSAGNALLLWIDICHPGLICNSNNPRLKGKHQKQGATFSPLSTPAPKVKCASTTDALFKTPSFKKIFCHCRETDISVGTLLTTLSSLSIF